MKKIEVQSKKPLVNRLSRRLLLKTVLGGITTAIPASTRRPNQPSPSAEHVFPAEPTPTIQPPETTKATIPTKTPEVARTPEDFRKEIEKKYNVEIRTIKELFSSRGKSYSPTVAKSPEQWDIERLKILDSFLDVLPPHMYAPDSSGKKMRITLGIASTNGMFATAVDGYAHEIELDYQRFTTENPRLSFIDVTHEFTHLLIPERMVIEDYAAPDGKSAKKVVFKSPWYDEIERILQEPFPIFKARKRQEVIRKGYIFVSNKGIVRDPQRAPAKSDDERDKDVFAEEFDYGLRKDYPGEFIPVLAQTYAQGKDYFFTMYTEYLDRKVVEKLYNFSKDNIFRGREYDSDEIKKILLSKSYRLNS